jgi:hypothetical protein
VQGQADLLGGAKRAGRAGRDRRASDSAKAIGVTAAPPSTGGPGGTWSVVVSTSSTNSPVPSGSLAGNGRPAARPNEHAPRSPARCATRSTNWPSNTGSPPTTSGPVCAPAPTAPTPAIRSPACRGPSDSRVGAAPTTCRSGAAGGASSAAFGARILGGPRLHRNGPFLSQPGDRPVDVPHRWRSTDRWSEAAG